MLSYRKKILIGNFIILKTLSIFIWRNEQNISMEYTTSIIRECLLRTTGNFIIILLIHEILLYYYKDLYIYQYIILYYNTFCLQNWKQVLVID